MILCELNIHHLRNIPLTQLTLHPQFNFFYGSNGSGKTSLLEAVYLLSSGHSFRTRETSPLVQYGHDELTVFARSVSHDTVSLQKNTSGGTQVRINQQPCLRSSDLARLLPCQLIYQDLFQIIDAGPSVRRNILDWGMFHVKHSYHGLWKDYKQTLKQRNALLRQKAQYQEVLPWDKLLVDLAEALHELRHHYTQALVECFQMYLAKLTDVPCALDYFKGWDKKKSGKALAVILKEQFTIDCQRQYTHSGAHQADIVFESNANKAKTNLSRGQQKIILIALKLAQAHLLEKPCLYLFDDISSELDTQHLQRLLACLMDIKGQFFITSIGLDNLKGSGMLELAKIYRLDNGEFMFDL